MLPTSNTSILQTAILGNLKGTAFNHLNALRQKHNLPADFVVNPTNPIAKIVVAYGWLIDKVEITYNLAAGGTAVLGNGGPNGTATEINIGANEVISSVSGLVGAHKDYGNKVFLNQISFSILNVRTGVTTVKSFGDRPQGEPFVITLPTLFAGHVAQADANTIGICALGVIKRGEF